MKVEYEISSIIYQFQKLIIYYSQMQLLSSCPYEKTHYEKIIKVRTEEVIKLMTQVSSKSNENGRTLERQKEFTLDELSTYDGANGRAAYVSVNGIVYDLSREATWGGGTHFGLYAGKDLSTQFMGCHKGMLEILNKLPKVGVLRK